MAQRAELQAHRVEPSEIGLGPEPSSCLPGWISELSGASNSFLAFHFLFLSSNVCVYSAMPGPIFVFQSSELVLKFSMSMGREEFCLRINFLPIPYDF